MLIDAQVHIWGAPTITRPWPEVHGKPHREIPYGAAEIIAQMDEAGVDRAVIVPPSWEGDRNDLAIDAVSEFPGRFGIMGRLSVPDHRSVDFARWRSTPGMLGLRFTFHRPEMRAWLTDGSAEWIFAGAATHGLPIMMLAPGQSPAVADVARRYGDLTLIVDHLNLPGESGRTEISERIAALTPLIECENVAIKISALPCYTDERAPYPELQLLIRRVVDAFGADRCMWGSDISRLPGNYADWVNCFREGTGPLSASEAAKVGGATLARLLHWPAEGMSVPIS